MLLRGSRLPWRSLVWMLVLVGGPLAALGIAPARASGEEGEVQGALTVDVKGNTVSVSGVVLVVTEDTRLRIDDKDATLAQLATFVDENPGTEAEAEYRVEKGQKIARKVKVEDDSGGGGEDEEELQLEGSLTADVVNSTVTVGGVVLSVTAATDIEAGDEHTDLAGLAEYLAANPGTRGEAHYQVVKDVRVAIKVETKGDSSEDGDEDEEDEQELVGILSVDLPARAIGVGSLVFQTSLGTEIKLSGQHITLTALATYLTNNPGTVGKVEYRVLDGVLVAREIKVLGAGVPLTEAEATGVVVSVDADGGTIQFLTDGASSLTLIVDAATELQVDDANVSLAELAGLLNPDLEVRGRVHYNPDTLVLREISVTVPVVQQEARIAGVNTRTHVVTFKLQAAAPAAARARKLKTTVLPGATIIRGRKILRLRDLKSGQRVTISTFSNGVGQITPEVIVR